MTARNWAIAITIGAMAAGLTGCRDERTARKKLEESGYTDIVLAPGSGQSYDFKAKKAGQDCEGNIVATLSTMTMGATCKSPIPVCGPTEPDACFSEAFTAEKTDDAKGAALYQRACDAGSALGCSNLGMKYEAGEGVEKNATKALGLFKQACEKKSALGCRNLGIAYEQGEGTKVDVAAAIDAYTKACGGGDKKGCGNLGVFYSHGTGVEHDAAKARELFQKACEDDSPAHCANLGFMLVVGDGGPEDKDKGMKLLVAACDHDIPHACRMLGGLMRDEKLPDPDHKMISLDDKACKLKDAVGCFELGVARERGLGGQPKDEAAALAAYETACQMNDDTGCFNLGVFSKYGRGGKVDMKKAAESFDKSCKLGYENGCAQAKLTPLPR